MVDRNRVRPLGGARRLWVGVLIAAVAGLFNYFNTFNNALCVEPTQPVGAERSDG